MDDNDDRQADIRPERDEHIGTDGLPLPAPVLHAYRDGAYVIAVCPLCAEGHHVYDIGDMRAPYGAADGFVRAPCDPIADIGGAYVREHRPGDPIGGSDDDGSAGRGPRLADPDSESEDDEA